MGDEIMADEDEEAPAELPTREERLTRDIEILLKGGRADELDFKVAGVLGMTRDDRLLRAAEILTNIERREFAARMLWRLRGTRLLFQRAQEARNDLDEMVTLALDAFEHLPPQLLPLLRRKMARAASRK